MKEANISGREVWLHDEPEALPIVRFQKFNEIILDESGIGSDMASVSDHLGKILIFNEKGDKQHVKQEVMNMSQNLAYVMEGINLSSMAFGVMVDSIDGVKQTDISDLALKKMMVKLNPQNNIVRLIVDELKKKLILLWKSILRRSNQTTTQDYSTQT